MIECSASPAPCAVPVGPVRCGDQNAAEGRRKRVPAGVIVIGRQQRDGQDGETGEQQNQRERLPVPPACVPDDEGCKQCSDADEDRFDQPVVHQRMRGTGQ